VHSPQGYVAATGRINHVQYPNGQHTSYQYTPVHQDSRLAGIIHLAQSGNPASQISAFAYTHQPAGNIASWTRNLGSAGHSHYDFIHDRADQLLTGELRQVGGSGSLISMASNAYDLGGNRISHQQNNTVSQGTYNELNQLKAVVDGGKLWVSGEVGEPVRTTVNGQPTVMDGLRRFGTHVPVEPGSNTITIETEDRSSHANTSTQQWTVEVIAGAARMFAYDEVGNLLDDGQRTYTWDTANRLVSLTKDGVTSEYRYDGWNRRVEKKVNGQVSERYLWSGSRILEKRDGNNAGIMGSALSYCHFDPLREFSDG